MKSEQEIIEDLKNWKDLIKPYATPEVKLARKEVWKTVLPFVLLFITAAIIYEFTFWGAIAVCFLAGAVR
jgi:omega-6 fatty acid desaturase (delta-12 desaturase)